VTKKPIKIFFQDYTGPDDSFEESLSFIREVFLRQVKDSKRQIYTHLTNATDRNNVIIAFNDVQHCVVLNSLTRHGIL